MIAKTISASVGLRGYALDPAGGSVPRRSLQARGTALAMPLPLSMQFLGPPVATAREHTGYRKKLS